MFSNYKKIKTQIKGKGQYTLWVADTDMKRSQGLKHIKSLPKKHGMIFVYDDLVNNAFTMKDVKIPLTIIFMDKNFEILEIINANPGQKLITPNVFYKYVIEI